MTKLEKAWLQVMQLKIEEVVDWQRDIGPLLSEIVVHQHIPNLRIYHDESLGEFQEENWNNFVDHIHQKISVHCS
jgi:hypothetical protein